MASGQPRPQAAIASALWCDGTEDDSAAASFAAASFAATSSSFSSFSPSPSAPSLAALVAVESEHEFALPHLLGTTSLISPLHVAEARAFVERAASRTRNCLDAQTSSLVRCSDEGEIASKTAILARNCGFKILQNILSKLFFNAYFWTHLISAAPSIAGAALSIAQRSATPLAAEPPAPSALCRPPHRSRARTHRRGAINVPVSDCTLFECNSVCLSTDAY